MTTEQARTELERRTNGALGLSIGEALDWLASDDAADLIAEAGYGPVESRADARRLLRDLTGVSA